jgi:hypothetical protein
MKTVLTWVPEKKLYNYNFTKTIRLLGDLD